MSLMYSVWYNGRVRKWLQLCPSATSSKSLRLRQFHVQINGVNCKMKQPKVLVPQVGAMCPMLFKMYSQYKNSFYLLAIRLSSLMGPYQPLLQDFMWTKSLTSLKNGKYKLTLKTNCTNFTKKRRVTCPFFGQLFDFTAPSKRFHL